MDARNRSAIILALTVPLSSLLGLARAMEETGAGTFWDVWAANLWGDLVFTAGTVATGWAVTRLVAGTGSLQGKGALAVAVANGFLYLKYPGLGLSDRGAAFRNLGIVVGAAVVVYLAANYVRGREGINLTQATSEIPPD